MIKSVNLRNFQSHKASDLSFSKGVNAIIGKTDSGKTAIIRALYWTFMNKPGGQSFISTFSEKKDKTSVRVAFDKSPNITRIKAKSENKYIVGETQFTSFGSSPPDEVFEASHIDRLNIQRQMDAPFILSMSAGEVSRYFNDIIGLDVIDSSLAESIRQEREAEKDLQRAKEALEVGEKELGEYDWLDRAKELYREAKIMWDRIDKKESKLVAIQQKLYYIAAQEAQIKELDFISKTDTLIEAAQAIDKDMLEQKITLDILSNTVDRIEVNRGKVAMMITAIITEEEELEKSFPDICPLCGRGEEND